jgi:hypothetical protein
MKEIIIREDILKNLLFIPIKTNLYTGDKYAYIPTLIW